MSLTHPTGNLNMNKNEFGSSRRKFLKTSGFGMLGFAGIAGLRGWMPPFPASLQSEPEPEQAHGEMSMSHSGFGAVGEVNHEANGFHPSDILTDFDYGEIIEENGQKIREWTVISTDKEIEIAPGIYFPAWVYGSATSETSKKAGKVVGTCPGPSLRCIEGERLRVNFINAGSHPHTMHFHGVHAARHDGVPGAGDGMIATGGSTVYEFNAKPYGCHLYHCHSLPLKRHVHKGLYGAFIVDPDPEKYSGAEKEAAKTRNHTYPENKNVNEVMMMMNGFDTNFDGDNEIYAANTVAFAYRDHPIPITQDKITRIYLINMTEFDPINSLHIHANFFDYYDHGTTLTPTLKTVDTIMQCQAQRGIIEVSFADEDFEPGMYMFHAHQSEFTELGWMGMLELS
jgi:FtsP/CotA-like multicopper oxidase with cupredoxin domain